MDAQKKVSPEDIHHTYTNEAGQHGEVTDNADDLQRHLGNRQIQLIAIGGSVGTALFISIGGGLHNGGPLGLLLAFTLYSCIIALINNGMAEMVTFMPVSGGFVRLAGKWVDEALGFTAGWNFFLYQAILIPFEITALNIVLKFWRDDIPEVAVCSVVIVLYGLCNVLAVSAYGEAEFWLSGGKVVLILILYCFTFITMVGGNPMRDVYGFRYWRNPGPMSTFLSDGNLGRFQGFLSALWVAALTIVGPEYISMVAGEAKRPRHYIKNAFKTVYWRFGAFFILGALCVGIIIPYNDPELVSVLSAGESSASASPYVIAMSNLGIGGLPHLVNALVITSIFSAGNTYTYCATRTLYSLSIEGRAPRFLRRCNSNGVPIYCFLAVMAFPFLSFLQLSDSSAVVLSWLTNLITAGGLINFIIMGATYIAFYRACKAQGVNRKSLPYTGWLQPWGTWVALLFEITVVLVYGYSVFLPGRWSVSSFLTYYTMVFVAPVLFVFWKLVHKTKWVEPHQVDLIWDAPLIDAYEASFTDPPDTFWKEMLGFLKSRNKKAHGVEDA